MRDKRKRDKLRVLQYFGMSSASI